MEKAFTLGTRRRGNGSEKDGDFVKYNLTIGELWEQQADILLWR